MLKVESNRCTQIGGLLALALAAACGGESEEDPDPTATTTTDAAALGSNLDAGVGSQPSAPAIDAGQCITTDAGSGAACTLAGGGFGYRRCVNGVPQGECISFLGDGGLSALLDSAIGSAIVDSAIGALIEAGVSFNDGSISFGDAMISLEAGSLKCPAGYECSSTFSAFSGGAISACVKTGELFPDTCTTAGQACKVEAASGTCQNVILDTYCIVPCN